MIKKIFGFLKKSLKYILLAVIAFRLIGGLNSCGKVSASAEELSEIAEYGGIDYSDYPSANLLPYPFSGISSTMLIDYTYNDDGSITINGTIPSGSFMNFYIRNNGELFLDAGTYSVELFGTNGQTIFLVTGCTNCSLSYQQGLKRKFTLTERDTIGNFVIQVKSGTYENLTLRVQFSKSDVYYPYSVPVAIQYKNGQEQGYNEGYESGKLVGQQTALNGIFANATISGYLSEELFSNNNSISFNLNKNFDFISGGINFYQTKIVGQLQNIAMEKWGVDYSDFWNATHLEINLAENVPLNQIDLMGQGNSLSFSGDFTVTDVDGNIYKIGWKYPEFPYQSVIPNDLKNQNILIKKISFDWGGGIDGIQVTIFQQGLGYESGYANGYNDGRDKGYNQGKDLGYKNGYTIGVKEGESVGYEKAVSEGVSGSGLLYGVFVLLKLFFKLITDLLGLKIAGDFTIGLFLIGIPATFMIINQVIKLVKNLMSAGGGKSDE